MRIDNYANCSKDARGCGDERLTQPKSWQIDDLEAGRIIRIQPVQHATVDVASSSRRCQ